ncbi:conserved hypothetical protein [Trichinella spiralis]|uniref:hypothetical protein n=1 Tax=Trichinella spiralis TaxID=6334 RepID=UPI0001EFCED1|nr:conserved hypothetical protein [Trichinella spiralis]
MRNFLFSDLHLKTFQFNHTFWPPATNHAQYGANNSHDKATNHQKHTKCTSQLCFSLLSIAVTCTAYTVQYNNYNNFTQLYQQRFIVIITNLLFVSGYKGNNYKSHDKVEIL